MNSHITNSLTNPARRPSPDGYFRKAELAKKRYQAIESEYLPPEPFMPLLVCNQDTEENKPRREGGLQAADDQARRELGKDYPLSKIGETATIEYLMRELDVEERLDGMIDRLLKRLLVLRGLKSLSRDSPSTPSNILPAPKKVA